MEIYVAEIYIIVYTSVKGGGIMTVIEKKLFKHGGSYAVDLPKEFVKSRNTEVIIKFDKDRLIVLSKNTLENLESEPEFKTFIKTLVEDSLKNPQKLKDINQVWNKEWTELLKDVDVEDE